MPDKMDKKDVKISFKDAKSVNWTKVQQCSGVSIPSLAKEAVRAALEDKKNKKLTVKIGLIKKDLFLRIKNGDISHVLEQALKFIDEHTFHPHRVVGLNNVRLNEYPTAALREALVNAVAHRSYDDNSRKTFLRLFKDRIEIASPGYPPQPLTLSKLRRGGYRPCSRNPLIAQTLATIAVMEQRGTGFARMRDTMLNHGLDEPKFEQQDGFFVVTLPGPAGDYDRITTPENAGG